MRFSIQHSAFRIQHSAFSILFACCWFLATGTARADGAGNALLFDGVDEYVSVVTNSAFKQTAALTLETWARKDSWSVTADEALVSCSDAAGYGLYVIDGTPDTIRGQVYLTGLGFQTVECDASSLTFGWHHFALTCDGQYTKLYVDGALRDTASVITGVQISYDLFSSLQIGAESSGLFFAGQIDEVRIWATARTPEEIRANMHLSLQSPFVDIGAYWRCDDDSGSLLTEASGNVYLLGTLSNMEDGDWIESTIPLGDGVSQSQTVAATGDVAFADTNVTLGFTEKTGTNDIVVTWLDGAPANPPASPALAEEYWVIQAHNEGTFTVDLTVGNQSGISEADIRDPSRVKLWRRDGSSDGAWELEATASDAETATVTFSGLTEFCQLALTHCPPSSLDLDGVDDCVTIPDSDSLDVTGSYTVEAWIKVREFGWLDGIASKYQFAGANGFTLRLLGGDGPYDGLNFGGMSTSTGVLTVNTWHHVAGVCDAGTYRIYIDGVDQSLTGTPVARVANTSPLCIGVDYYSSPRFFDGMIDEVRLWATARTAQEIRENMHVSLTGSESGLVGYWQCDHGVNGATVFDVSANGNNGTFTDMDAETDWIESTAPLAPGTSYTETVNATGEVTFTGTDLTMDVTAKTDATTFVVSRLNRAPNQRPDGAPMDDEYWVVHAYDGGSYTTNLTVSGQERLTAEDDANPSGVALHRRDSGADGTWTQLASADAVDSDTDAATFNGVTGFSQLVLTHNGPDDVAGDCLDFDGVDEYVQANEVSDAMAGISALTMEAWIYPRDPDGADDTIVGFHDSSGNNMNVLFLDTSGKIYYHDNETGYAWGTEVLAMNTWHHVAVTIDGANNGTLYLNGEVETTFTTTLRPTSDGMFSIGADWDSGPVRNDYFNGLIDEVIVWSVARTQAQIRESMNEALLGSELGVIAYWQFNDGPGSSTLADRSGNGYDGTLVNMEAAEDWTSSTVVIGATESQEVTETGTVTFGDTGITLDFTAKGGTNTFVITHMSEAPTPVPAGDALDSEYWLIRVYGTGTYTCDVLVGGQEQLVVGDADAPWGVKLRHRDLGSDGSWTPFSTAASANSGTGVVTFTCLSDPALDGQFTLTRDAPRAALEFDGVDDYVTGGTGLDLSNSSFTVEFWARRDSAGTWDAVVGMGNATDYNELMIGFQDNDHFTFGFSGDDLDSTDAYTDDTWHHWACVYDASSNARAIYRDGVLVDADTTGQDFGAAGQRLYIGRRGYSDSQWFHGGLDELRLWNTARSETEIRQHMHLTLVGDESGLLAYWPCDDVAGTTLTDVAGNGHDATLTNMDPDTDWTSATPILGPGVSETQIVDATGVVDFDAVGVTFDVTENTDTAAVVITHLFETPNALPTGTSADDETWVVESFGDGAFTADVTIADQWRLTAADEASPSRVRLRRRDADPDATWMPLASASGVSTDEGTAVFDGVCVTGQLAVVHDAPGRALSLDGVLSYATADGACAGVAGGALTVQAWARPDSGGDGNQDAILSFHTADHSNLIIVAFRPTTDQFYYWDTDFAAAQLTTDTFPKDQWHHIALSIDSDGSVCMYVNGTLQVSGLTTTVRPTADGCFSIGQEWDGTSASDYFQGLVDEVAVWSCVRTQAEIRATMHLSLSGREEGLEGYWRFDDGSGSSAIDVSGGGNDANFSGVPLWATSTPAVGFGVSATETVNAKGLVAFNGTGLALDITEKAGGDTTFVTSCLHCDPEPEPQGYAGDRYWVVDEYGDSTFAADVQLSIADEVTGDDQQRPWRGKLYRRDTGSDDDWSFETVATEADIETQTFTFEDATELGQLALSHYEPDRVAGTALVFDGTDDYVNVPHSLSLIPTTELTVEAWVKLDDATDHQTIVNKLESGNSGFALAVSSDKLYARIRDLTSYYSVSGGTVPDGEWTHLAVTWKTGGRMIGYVNGVEVANVAASETYPIYSSTEPLHIGVGDDDSTYQTQGLIDEVRVWRVQRTVQQIRETMHVTPAGIETGLVGYWQFNEGTGTTTADASGFGNTGTLTNMDSGTDWVVSTAAVGGGNAATLTADTPQTLVFDTTELTMDLTSQQGESTFVVSHILGAPSPQPDGTTLADEYWIIRDYGTGTSVYDLILGGQDVLDSNDATTPARVRVHNRSTNDDGAWAPFALASAVDTSASAATFSEVAALGQLVLTRDPVLLGPGTALDFDGTDDCVATSLTDLSGTEICIEYWFKGSSIQSAVRWQNGSYVIAGWNNQHVLSNDGGTTGLSAGDPAIVTDGNWHHLAFSWKMDTTNGFVTYLDGNIVAKRDSGSSPIPDTDANVYLGSLSGSGEFMEGTLDEVRIWSVARTTQQIRESMYHPLTGAESGLIAYWRFDDGDSTTLTDLSGNGHNGTLTNMDSATDWVQSDIPVATGISATVVTAGVLDEPVTLDFAGTEVSLRLTADAVEATPIVVSRLLGAPNTLPSETLLGNQYWLLRAYDDVGAPPDFSGTLRFHSQDELTAEDVAAPARVRIHHRVSNSVGSWARGATACGIDDDTVLFAGSGDVDDGQLILTHDTPSAGNALDFDGTDDYVEIPHNAGLKPAAALTVETWAYVDDWTSGHDGEKLASCTQDGGYNLAIQTSKLDGAVYANGGYRHVYCPRDELAPGWHHLALTSTGELTRLYVDGILRDTEAIDGFYDITYDGDNSLLLGAEAGGGSGSDGAYFQGRLDEFRVWSVVRSEEQIRAGLTRELSGSEAGLELYYRFDQGTPGGDNAGEVTCLDQTANKLDGNLCSFTLNGETSNWVSSYALVRADVCSSPVTNAGDVTLTWSPPAYGPSPTSYILDVATDPEFTMLVSGYDGLDVGTVTSYQVTGLDAYTTYYYRIRSENDSYGEGQAVTGYVTPAPHTARWCLHFDGIDDGVQVERVGGNVGLETFSLTCWFKQEEGGDVVGSGAVVGYPLITKGYGEGDGSNIDANYFLAIDADGRLLGDFEDMANGANHPITGTTVIQKGTWYFAALVSDPTATDEELRLYLYTEDGSGGLEGTADTDGATPRSDSIHDVGIGTAFKSTGSTDGRFAGDMAEVGIWSKALSAEDITLNHNYLYERWAESSDGGYHLNRYLPFREAGGDRAADYRNAQWGLVHGNPVRRQTDLDLLPAGPNGWAVELNGTTSRYSVDDTDVTIGSTPSYAVYRSFVVECWARRDSATGDDCIFSEGDSSDGGGADGYADEVIVGFRADNTFQFGFYYSDEEDDILLADASYADDAWHHWAVTFDAADMTRCIYRDGELVATDQAANYYTGMDSPCFGRCSTDGYFHGALDELRIWYAVRTQEQIRTNRCRSLRGDEDDLQFNMRFDQWAGRDGEFYAFVEVVSGAIAAYGTDLTLVEQSIAFAPAAPREQCLEFGEDLWLAGQEPSGRLGTGFDLASGSLTFEFWAQRYDLTSANAGLAFCHGTQWGAYFMMYFVGVAWDNGLILEYSYDGDTSAYQEIALPTSLTDDDWHHWAVVVIDGAETGENALLRVFRDGGLVQETALEFEHYEVFGELSCGSNFDNSFFGPVRVDEFRVWSTARTGDEIAGAMSRQLTGDEENLEGYYTFNEGNGHHLFDSSQHRWHGRLYHTSDRYRVDHSFPGGFEYLPDTNQALQAPAMASLAGSEVFNDAGDFTWEAWIRPVASDAWQNIISRYDHVDHWTTGAFSFMVDENEYLELNKNGQSVIPPEGSEISVTLNQWQHVALRVEADTDGSNDTVTLFVDGAPQYSTDTVDVGASLPAHPYTALGSTFSGHMDEVLIWSVARTDQEILNSYKRHRNGVTDGLEAYIDFDDVGDSVASDRTGNGHHAWTDGDTLHTLDADQVPELFPALPGEWAASFDGINDYAVIAADPVFDGDTFSVEFWVQQDEVGASDAMLDKGAPSSDFYFATQDNSTVSTAEPTGNCVSMTYGALDLSELPAIFNGDNDTISDFTVELWVKPDLTDSYGTLFEITKSTANEGNFVRLMARQNWRSLYLIVGDDAGSGDHSTRDKVGSDYFFTYNRSDTWFHIAATFDADATDQRLRLYVNGIEQSAWAESYNPTATGASFFNSTGHGDLCKSQMDEIRIWNVPRTQAEIVADMHRVLSSVEIAAETNLLHYYKLEEALLLEDTAQDSAGANVGSFSHSTGKQRLTSTVPAAAAVAEAQTEAAGFVQFSTAGLTLNYSDQGGADVTAVKITSHPSCFPPNCQPFESQYWILHRNCDSDDYWFFSAGEGSPYTADMAFSLSEELTDDDAINPQLIGLYRRKHTDVGDWEFVANATAVDPLTNSVTFQDVSVTSGLGELTSVNQSCQFLVGHQAGQGVVFGMGLGTELGSRELSYVWADDAWHHVCGTYDGATMRLYADGELVGTAMVSANMTDNEIRIGSYLDGTGFFTGQLDELRFWDHALSLDDIAFYADKELRGNEDGLLGYWKFREGGGITAADSTGNGHDATLYNGLARVEHDNDYVSLPVGDYSLSLDSDTLIHAGGLTNIDATLTVEAWVYKSGETTNAAVLSLGDGALAVYAARSGTECMAYYDDANGWVLSSALVPVGEWHHLAWAIQEGPSGYVNFYLDGELVDQIAIDSALPDLTGDAFIGCTNAGEHPFIGQLTEIRLWDAVRGAGDIATYMDRRLGGNEVNLVAYWPCTDGSGQLIADEGPNGYDAVFYYAFDFDWEEPEGLVFEEAPAEANALSFDGNNTSVSLPYTERPDVFTIAAWIKPDAAHADDAADDVIIGWGGPDDHFAELRITTEDKLLYCEFDGDWQPLVASPLIPEDEWTHVAMTKSGTTVTLFINGVAKATGTIDQEPVLDSLAIGSAAEAADLRPFYGLIDEVQFWNVALTTIVGDELWGDEDNLARYYKFDEGGGSTAIDYTGSGFYNGRLSSGLDEDHRVSQDDLPMTLLSERQNALEFDGVDDYLDVTHFDRPDPMMVSAWIKPSAVSSVHTILSWSDSSDPENGHRIAFRINGSHLEYGENASTWTAVTSTGTIPKGTWTHVAVVKDASTVTLYIDGVEDGSGTISGTPVTDTLTVGMQPGDPTPKHFYRGLLEELQIWNLALTADDLAAQRYNTRRGNETGLVLYYNFDQPSEWMVEDQTANGYAGSMQNIDFCNLHRIEIADTELDLDNPPAGEYVLNFDGVDDYASIDGLAPTAYTVSIWFKPDADIPDEDVTLLAGPNFGLILHPDNSISHWWTTATGTGTQTLENAVVRSDWQCVVAVNDGLTARLYHGEDGIADFATDVAADSAFMGGQQSVAVGTIYVGDDPNDENDAPFEGCIEELAIWGIPLPETDIEAFWGHEVRGTEDGLLAFYNFNGGDPAAVADIAGDAQDAVLHNMVLKSREDRDPADLLSEDAFVLSATWDAADSAPVALQFDGADDYGVIPHAAMIMADTSFTFEFWLRTGAWSGQVPLVTNASSSSTAAAWGFFLDGDEEHWSFRLLDDITLTGGAVNDNSWHHLCVVYDADAGLIYAYHDGTQVDDDVPADIAGADNADNIAVGSYVNQTVFLAGFLDEIRRWNVALSATEVSDRFNRYQRASRPELAGYWRVHETSTTEVSDLSSGNPMTLNNMSAINLVVGADFAPPAPGELAVELDGTDDYIQIPKAELGLEAFTIALWFKKTGTGGMATTGSDGVTAVPLVAKGREESSKCVNYFLGIDDNNKLVADFEASDGTNYPLTGNTAIADDTWYHAALTYDPDAAGNGLKLYLNGEPAGSRSTGGVTPCSNSGQDVAIGAALNSGGIRAGSFEGVIEEVRIWSVALSQTELEAGINNHRRGGETGLVAMWLCDSGWGDTLVDAGRLEIDGTLKNMDTDNCWVDGKVLDAPQDGDHAIAFDSTGQHVELDASCEAEFDFSGNFTVEFWLYVEEWNTPSQAIVSKGDTSWQIRRYEDTSQIAFTTPGIEKDTDDDGEMDDAPDLVSEADIPVGEWTHIAVVYDADMHRKHLYINGTLDASVTDLSGFVQTNAYPVWVGANPETDGLELNGAVDELRIWNVLRSDVRIDANYNRDVRENEDGLVGRWHFNEGSGTVALDSKEGTAINGTLLNLENHDRIDGVVLEEWDNEQHALLLDGVDEDVSVDALSADLTGGFTMECWIRPDVLQEENEDGEMEDITQYVFDISTADGQISVTLRLEGSDLVFEITEGGTVTSSLVVEGVFTPGVWAHVAVSVDDQGAVHLYIDGEEQTVDQFCLNGEEQDLEEVDVVVTIPVNTTWDGITFGSNGSTDGYFTGAIDEFRLWDEAREEAEIELFSERELFDGTEGLIGYWRLNEGTGDAVFGQTDTDTAATANNIEEEEDWVDGKYIVDDSVNCSDLDLTPAPDAAGLWQGQITLNKVSEVSAVSTETQPTDDEMVIDILLHVDATGQVRLLKDVTFMRTDTDDEDNATMVLVTDETKLADFVGLVNRDGVLIGLRKSTVFYDFDGNDLPMDGGLAFGHVAYGLITIPADHPTNPYRHKYHPDHEEGYRIDRSFFLVFNDEAASGDDVEPGQGVDTLTGTYQETLHGLHKRPIVIEGDFELNRISSVAILNNEE